MPFPPLSRARPRVTGTRERRLARPRSRATRDPTGNQGSNAPTGTSATTTEKNAAKLCKAERESLGAEAFADKYGTNANKRNAFGKCVSQHAKQHGTVDEHNQAKLNAAKLCKAERLALGTEAFADKYGTNANKRNAFGKCVSQHAKTKSTSSSSDDD